MVFLFYSFSTPNFTLSENTDLAVLIIDTNPYLFSPIQMDIEKDLLDGEEVVLYGYPESITQWTSMFPNPKTNSIPGLQNPALFSRATIGIVSAQYNLDNTSIIEHDMETLPGLSGSPLIRVSNKKVIGVNEGHRTIGKRGEYQGPKFAINTSYYIPQIEKAINLLLQTSK